MFKLKRSNCRLTLLALALTTTMTAMAERVVPETARKAATTFFNNNGAKTAQLTDLSKEAGFANLYIFAAEQGFVVMAADDCVQPILGYSLDGHFSTENMPDNARGWLQGYDNEIQFAIDNRVRASAETAKLWKDLIDGNSKAGRATTVVAPPIQTKWNQNKYYNNLCPAVSDGPNGKAYTGCVATAMAQIMKYWEYPSKGIGSHSYTWRSQTLSADFGETTYDWDNMGLYYECYYPDPTSGISVFLDNSYHTTEKVAAVATLMYHCGVSVEMNYGGNSTGGSSASTSAVANALKTYFNYSTDISYKQKSSFSDADWIDRLIGELDAGRPLQYRGSSEGGSGHSFVCDGYDNNNYFHFNWGWAGDLNGFFSLSNLDTGANSQAGAGNGDYTYYQAAIFGIQPSPNTADPTNLTYTITNLQGLTLQWTASGAASYNIYRDGNLVGNSTTNSYSETAPFGSHSYYVRSVDASGNLSLLSNTVTVTVPYQYPVVNDLSATLSGNNAVLNWTAPEWCYPEYESAKLNYGEGTHSEDWSTLIYGHRHLATNLAQYAGKAVYKVSTYITCAGTYSLYVFLGANVDYLAQGYYIVNDNYLAYKKEGVQVTATNAWYDFELSSPVILDGSQDLCVLLKRENSEHQYPTPSFDLSSHNVNAFYAGQEDDYFGYILYDAISNYNGAWFINTYLTDGTYTYNLYDNGSQVATNISGTTYEVANPTNNTAHVYTLKTNYYGGLTAASNKAGLAVGLASLNSLNLGNNDNMTVASGSTLTVSGALSNSNPARLVIEDGAQLVHSSANVNATVKKSIASYTIENEGWNFIASPLTDSVVPSTENGLLSGDDYDLYYYDEPAHYWRNHKPGNENSGFDLAPTQGYLYANKGKLDVAGYDVLYSFDNDLQGWTLIDADGDGYNWHNSTEAYYSGEGCLASDSYYNGPLSPNNFVISPKITFTSTSSISFWAKAKDSYYFKEHFGVAVSTTGNTNASSFTTIEEWTLPDSIEWHQYTVDLGQYAGQEGYVAIRHFDCTDQWTLYVDEVELKDVFTEGQSPELENVVLSFAGQVRSGFATVNVPLSYASVDGKLKGFNLVGNPFAHNVTSYTRNNVVEECYRLNANGSDILPSTIDEEKPLLPAEGFFVKATNANASITFNEQTRGDNASSTSSGAIQIDLTQNGLTLDRFIVKRDGEPLEKLTLNENSPIIYATHNGQDMAVVTTEGIEQTIQLKASKDDTYTLSARMKNMDLAYLHLIDNATGADVDLLQTPEYTFNASATDYASRFKLVFFANGDIDGSNDSFAFHSNGNWIIINDGEATLQVVDLMGRIISNERISGTCNKSINAPAGVYLLRLVCGKDIKTQKVVIE